MFKAKMIENEKEFKCQHKHGQPILLVVLDPKLEKKQRLLCNKCMENFESDAKTIGFQKLIYIIEDIIDQNMNSLENIVQKTVQQLSICIKSIQELKTQLMKLFDSMIIIAQDWTQNLLAQSQQFNQYSLYDELDCFIKNQNINYISNIKLINNINISWKTKLSNNLNQYIQDKDKLNFKQIKEKFINIGCSSLSQNSEIKLNLIDQSVKQNVQCKAIVFDSSGSIMVSTEYNDIKVWSFLNGTIKLIKTLQGHNSSIQCLVYSKKQNFLISSAGDKTIRCWKELDKIDWSSSKPYQQHTNIVGCIILNSNEDLLFSGSFDKSIKVWKVDFNKNILTYMYSLDKHENKVNALSLNQSETQLVSCADSKNQIIIWERKEQDKFEFKHFVTQSIQEEGLKIKFIKDNQFIWITGGKEIDKLYVFELKEGVFQENQEKTIQLITNNEKVDEYRFPIIYNKERNLIVVRHKTYIYIIREINNGKFKIVEQLNCETKAIQGTITNNGQYLVFWDEKTQGYSIYELLNK
ncbi:unnamed protein product [Paramecium primaurelia]|uniref:WD40-repeat-containing domain n=1 Tax=Paramecium primaurelia TaxID=5886 RepID=A0A8S1MFX7_PARPR|nr:unnamed protein product [Paramecium primaurelia]